ncbi:mitochondrial carrier [Cystobasidium minutum MCA 4210]|uniref:mitochondrial carrier n=1 Tax=Cystobasidium minutum MCA 4210 TaxID=1397322 RepID=UPI0034CF2B70|eukprot:jgi/Rhomi1/59488/CE59487_1716
MPQNGKPKAKTGTSLMSGALSGLTSCVILQPLDLLKTRLQQGDSSLAALNVKSSKLTRDFMSKGRTAELAKLILKNDGITGLWRGTTPTIARNVPGVALYFASLNQLRSVLPNSTGGNLIAGATARTSVGFVLMPMTVVKTRMESSLFKSQGIPAAIREILATQGPKGLFAGFWPTTIRDAPTAGIFLVAYEQAKHMLSFTKWMPQSTKDASAGAFAAGFSTLATAPFDTIKTRRQIQPEKYTRIMQTASLILREQGPVGFFRGVTLRCVRKAASSGIAWSIYEGLIRKYS